MFLLTILRNNLMWLWPVFPLMALVACDRRAAGSGGSGLVRAVLAIWLTAALLGLGGGARAGLDDALIQAGWSEFTFEDKQAKQFLRPAGQPDIIQIDTDNSVSIAYLPFSSPPVNLKRTPYLTFSWQRLGPAVDTGLTKKGGDDRTLAVYVAFPYQPERASFKERLLRPFVEASEGDEAPGRVLTYLWGGGQRRGGWFENPYTGSAGWMQIVQLPTDPEQVWFSHRIDVRTDFMNRFGYPPPNPSYIAIAADSDDTKVKFSAQVRSLGFSGG